MPTTERGKAFDAYEPDLSDEEIRAAQIARKVVVSFKGKPVLASKDDVGFIAVKFAFIDGTFRTVLLDQFSAQALHHLIQTVNGIEWKTEALKPKGSIQ